MDNLTIDVPEGEYCGNCTMDSIFRGGSYFCRYFNESIGGSPVGNKCPACLKSCQQYRDEHDYEKALGIIETAIEIGAHTKKYRHEAECILKALNFNKEV